ncbi:MAG: bifunctional glutamate N-acetyltransferase/amino-acid acetyltransferase ArgJ [Erysipelotrichaceae bacterium]|nr:bifunctional glutamate N-acetyltransferase/amino-acid acetyltransferase ArgJ [Erysipelotrichaceae bacterium]
MKEIIGGVTAAKGFSAGGIHCGVKKSNIDKKDVALIVSDCMCSAAGIYTKNIVKAAPVLLTMNHLKDGKARAIVVNSGNANACAPFDMENAYKMALATADLMNISPEDVIVASTGVIGQTLNIKAIEEGLPKLYKSINKEGFDDAAQAIMTTDLVKKEHAVSFKIGENIVSLGGMAKGSGMIHPNMGTMLCFITTDIAISSEMLKKALIAANKVSFNRVSIDGDTSTNDMCVILANGMANNKPIDSDGEDFDEFLKALTFVCTNFARDIANDGEGATHLITCKVSGAKDEQSAENISKSIISSTLTKAAIFGGDANWGRILCAMGYSGEIFDPEKVDIAFASNDNIVEVCKQGKGLPFDEKLAKSILLEREVIINVTLCEGNKEAVCWGCDMTYDYIRINGDYRT